MEISVFVRREHARTGGAVQAETGREQARIRLRAVFGFRPTGNACCGQALIQVEYREWNVLMRRGMTVELVSDLGGRVSKINRKALAKLLHMAYLHGWRPERVPHDWPSNSWETEIIVPHLSPYLPGNVSNSDAEGLRKALTRAIATGDVAADGTVPFASVTLLQVAREGGFKVRENRSEFGEIRPLFAAAAS